jgi:hypothetical protein
VLGYDTVALEDRGKNIHSTLTSFARGGSHRWNHYRPPRSLHLLRGLEEAGCVPLPPTLLDMPTATSKTHPQLETLRSAMARRSITFHLADSGPRRGLEPKPPPRRAIQKSVERIGGTQRGNHIGVRISHGHDFDTRRIKKKRWMCGSAARAVLAQLHVQFKTRRRSTFETERPLMHPSTTGPAYHSSSAAR